jgi:hypothetical protein
MKTRPEIPFIPWENYRNSAGVINLCKVFDYIVSESKVFITEKEYKKKISYLKFIQSISSIHSSDSAAIAIANCFYLL